MKPWLLYLLFPFFGFAEERAACVTEVTVKDCSGGVKGAKVTIRTCNPDGTFTLTTDKNGKAVTPTCQDNICNMSVVARVDDATAATATDWRDNCSGDNKHYSCVFNLCKPQQSPAK